MKRVVMCSGKVYYDLLEQRRKSNQLTMSPLCVSSNSTRSRIKAMQGSVAAVCSRQGFLSGAREEPLNRGAWYCSQHHFREVIPFGASLRYAGRPASASPAVGYMSVHQKQQQDLVNDALNVE